MKGEQEWKSTSAYLVWKRVSLEWRRRRMTLVNYILDKMDGMEVTV